MHIQKIIKEKVMRPDGTKCYNQVFVVHMSEDEYHRASNYLNNNKNGLVYIGDGKWMSTDQVNEIENQKKLAKEAAKKTKQDVEKKNTDFEPTDTGLNKVLTEPWTITGNGDVEIFNETSKDKTVEETVVNDSRDSKIVIGINSVTDKITKPFNNFKNNNLKYNKNKNKSKGETE